MNKRILESQSSKGYELKTDFSLRTGLSKKYLSYFHRVPILPRTPALLAVLMLDQSNDAKEPIQSTKALLV